MGGHHLEQRVPAPSDNYLRLIPTGPSFVPVQAVREQAEERLRELLPHAEDVRAALTEHVELLTKAATLRAFSAPRAAPTWASWWPDAMDRAHVGRLADLTAAVPCCGAVLSLKNLR